jgi:flagellar biosynthesis protein FlhA
VSEPTLKASPGLLDAAAAAAALLGVLALAVLPLPAAALDLLLATAICLSMLVFLVAVYVERPLEFSAFPSLLLLITLFRLSLNIASTRIILLHGGSGAHAVGRVIQAFGQFAIGGNFVVGAVVFLILVIVNFVVITKGAERISEVAARFTLDSMPGKQMAVDADLGAGLINEGQARERRHDIECEADFHGAMDGAAKFVRGDAVAGLLIVGINVVGGMIVGVAQRGLSVGDAARTYTVLSVGEGLVSQIPALLVSTGAALLTTRASSSKSLGSSLGAQLFSRSRPMGVAAVALAALGLLPGMPHLAFLSLASVAGYLSFRSSRGQQAAAGTSGDGVRATAAADHGKPEGPEAQKKELEGLMPLDLLSLDVGLDLLPLVDAAQGGELLGRIGSLRKQLALELGFIVPAVHVRDDLRLRPTGYRICISGSKVAQGEVRQGRLLAIDPTGRATTGLAGDVVREPTFGLAAKWILPSDRLRAENAGCTVVDASTVIATHITEVVRRHAHELLGRRQAQEILDIAGHQDSKVVEELIPHLMSLGDVIKVLRNLLAEGVSVRDARTILETLADHAARVKDPGELTELVRQRLSRQISLAHAGDSGELCAMVLDPRAEDAFRTGGRGHDPQLLSRLTRAIEDAARQAMERDQSPLLVVAPDVRRAVAQVALRHVPGLTVLSYREIDPSIPFVTRGVVAAGAVPPVTASTQGARRDRKEMSP